LHELAITQSIVDAVRERLGDAPVRVVTVEIGRLSGVVADSVRFCFELCTEGTSLAVAELEVLEVPGSGHCRSCGADFDLADPILLCTCGSAEVEITGGQELRIKQVEVV
jgi:hydrogenase nickel incorporation protein HypA/HybF